MSRKLEQEAKFRICDLKKLADRLKTLGASLKHSRTHELNLRFDTPQGHLAAALQVLRLRQDDKCRMTFKGRANPASAVSARDEIEFEVSDLVSARQLLEALGYQAFMTYEKYRSVYQLGAVEVSLDELPCGHFCEIEGSLEADIRAAASQLGLDWSSRSPLSYLGIFNALRQEFSLDMQDLTFAAFEGVQCDLQKIGLACADSF